MCLSLPHPEKSFLQSLQVARRPAGPSQRSAHKGWANWGHNIVSCGALWLWMSHQGRAPYSNHSTAHCAWLAHLREKHIRTGQEDLWVKKWFKLKIWIAFRMCVTWKTSRPITAINNCNDSISPCICQYGWMNSLKMKKKCTTLGFTQTEFNFLNPEHMPHEWIWVRPGLELCPTFILSLYYY